MTQGGLELSQHLYISQSAQVTPARMTRLARYRRLVWRSPEAELDVFVTPPSCGLGTKIGHKSRHLQRFCRVVARSISRKDHNND